MLKTLTLAAATAVALASTAFAAQRVERVTFASHGEQIVGDLYLPEDLDAMEARPALVVTGAWMTVKEQMSARYAREMADRGFVALTFDFRGWGESGGARRQYEDPSDKIADIEAAVAYLATRPETDNVRIGGLGICASSGYMVTAAAKNTAIKSVALVAPWLHDAEVVERTYGGKDGVAQLEAVGDAAEAAYRSTGKQAFLPAASLTDDRAIMFKVPYYTEPDRGMIPAWRNETDPAFWRGWLTFDAIQAAPRLHQPFLMVHSEAAAIPQGAHKFYTRLTNSKPKRVLWLDEVTQFDFYDRAAPVKAASDAVDAHFRTTLGSAGKAGQ
ncbi:MULTISPECIES: CocE/NonD family hydrolase [unclassified Mesorhizobium]|uniref:alpha/beta hydrolase n=1 Tax=unclassified Mesorhizobium TaxID=325217 RepID=UPI000FD5FFA7|nr:MULTISPECIES: CocE/NonD family hydrolase [unclassified Mesorhizobium]RVB75106.1 alpha/beta hydrolase [Mesorhizobium sp. M6A.T.Cr.TU.014.01.1.1]RWQ05322.1 MAG: alpha/beta hydrolase [Mesorhizobium sp.]RWQ11527.1 MAG: alpha/beta hydrolase [Mesorhizobium sp.]